MLNKEIKTLIKILFILYLIGLVLLLDFKITEPQMVIKHLGSGISWFQGELLLQPFRIIKKYTSLAHSWDDWFVRNLVGNICLFMPFGFILPMIKKKNGFLRIFFWGVLFAFLLTVIFQRVPSADFVTVKRSAPSTVTASSRLARVSDVGDST